MKSRSRFQESWNSFLGNEELSSVSSVYGKALSGRKKQPEPQASRTEYGLYIVLRKGWCEREIEDQGLRKVSVQMVLELVLSRAASFLNAVHF